MSTFDKYKTIQNMKTKPEFTEVIKTMNDYSAEGFLTKAKHLLAQRGQDYDSEGGERSAGRVAAAFNGIKGKEVVSASDIWMILVLLKMVRQETSPDYHPDSAEDQVTYSALMAEELAK